MSERFFDITDSDFGRAQREYFDNHDQLAKNARLLAKESKFISNKVAFYGDTLYLKPEGSDADIFGNQLKIHGDSEGYHAFKKNSGIGKQWRKLFKESIDSRSHYTSPQPQLYSIWDVCQYGKGHQTSVIREGDRFYMSISGTNDVILDENTGYIEIKGSEFYRIKELMEQNEVKL